jgi:hypothetical protein
MRTFIRQKNPENVPFKLPNITTEFVHKQLRKLSASMATILDDLKLSAEIIAPHIVSMCNTSINSAHL